MTRKNYSMHPEQTHIQPLYCTIPLEEYEYLNKRIKELEKENQELKKER